MASFVKETVRIPDNASAASTNVALPSGGVFPLTATTVRKANITKHRVDLANLTCTITSAVGGQGSAVGQKLFTLPEGQYLVLGSKINLSLTTAAGLSAATVVCGLGTASATSAADGALTSTEADILASTTGPASGTLVAATAKAVQLVNLGTGTQIGQINATAGTKDVYLNIGGTWTHASGGTKTFTTGATSYVELTLVDLGDL